MKQILHTIWMALLVTGAAQAQLTDEQARNVVSDWNSAVEASGKGRIDAQALSNVGNRYRAFLTSTASTPSQIHLQEKGAESHIELTLAQAWASAGDFIKAAQYLEAQIALNRQSGGDFLQSSPSRNRESLVNDVLELHSEIIANTGVLSSVPGSGYQVFAVPSKDGKPRFAFVYRVEGTEEAQIELEGLADDEERRMIRLSEKDSSNHFRLGNPAQIIGKRDQITVTTKPSVDDLAVTIGGITKLIEYSRFGVPKVRLSPKSQIELRVGAGKIEQPLAAIERVTAPQQDKGSSTTPSKAAATTPSPSVSLPPTKVKASEAAKLAALAEEPTSSTPWSVVVVLIVAATGLLWLLVKKRK